MNVAVVLGASLLLQFIAAFLALRLIRITGRKLAWGLIATAVFLMAVRRSITFYRLMSGDLSYPPDLSAELVALFISVLMLTGIASIGPLFLSISRSEESCRESEERYRSLFQDSPISLWVEDLSEIKTYIDGLKQKGVTDFEAHFETHPEDAAKCVSMVKVIDVNAATLKLYGATSKEALLAGIGQTMNDASRRAFRKGLVAIAEGRASIEHEAVTQTLTGQPLETTVRWSVLRGHEKTYARAIISITDETERKNMERELIKAQRLESLGVLAGGLAHDFNNILTAIMGNISLARMHGGPAGGKTYDLLEDAEKAAARARDLTQQLLTFSKGGAPIKRTLSIGDIIREMSGFALRGSNVIPEMDIAHDLWPVEVDEGQISQAINNIVINADQAMPRGGTVKMRCMNVTVRAGEDRQLHAGRYVKLSVTDEGVGIPEDHLSKIFDPYYTTKHKGSGLGLATAYSIVQRHGGLFTVQSQTGIGTTFNIFLPASDRELPPRRTPEKRAIRGSGKILVMDDDAGVRDIAGKALKNVGYDVQFAENGGEAVELFRMARESSDPFDVLIMDLTVPGGMGGEEAMKRILEIDPDAKAIVSSGYSTDPVMSDYGRYGFRGVVVKPYNVEKLSEEVNRVAKM